MHPQCCPHCPTQQPPNRLYSAIMTPVTLISFLISLALVDAQYTAQRPAHSHSKAHSLILPAWLHGLIFTSVSTPKKVGRNADQDGAEGYYHTKQKKLLRLEAEDAFRVRGAVIGALAVVVVLGAVGVVWAGKVLVGLVW